MKKIVKKLFIFLASLKFAIFLIASLALWVAWGTVVEAMTLSHSKAVGLSYQNPFFEAILAGLFVNILFSALRRYPFSKRHIPFLLTHLGLLMVISGVIVKNRYGIQASLSLSEGIAAAHALKNDSWALQFERYPDKGMRQSSRTTVAIAEGVSKSYENIFFKVINIYSNSDYKVASWIKQGAFCTVGKAPIPVEAWREGSQPTSHKGYFGDELSDWQLVVVHASDASEVVQQLQERKAGSVLLVVEDGEYRIHFIAIASNGRVWRQTDDSGAPLRLNAYHQGFGGYSEEVKVPLSSIAIDADDLKEVIAHKKAMELRRRWPEIHDTLAPQLQQFSCACDDNDADVVECLYHLRQDDGDTFFSVWPEGYDDEKISEAYLNYDTCQRYTRLVDGVLQLPEGCSRNEKAVMLSKLNPHGKIWLELEEPFRKWMTAMVPQKRPAELLLPLHAYEYYRQCAVFIDRDIPFYPDICLEAFLYPQVTPQKPQDKPEDDVAAAQILFSDGKRRQLMTLPYEKNGAGFRWPLLGGSFRVRFQPEEASLPCKVRLRQARKVNYPGSTRPFAYECDLLITDVETGEEEEVALSMNNVYEKEQYRFYLANIGGSDDGIKSVQLIVNKDPAKYLLTYPGAIVMVVGIVLLFAKGRNRREHN